MPTARIWPGWSFERLAALPGIVIRAEGRTAIDADAFDGRDVAGKAVLVHTGWDRHWRTEAYQTGHPFLTEAAARLLVERGAALVGIDSHNIDDTSGRSRPVHTILLGAGVLICEHMTNLARAARRGLRLHRRAAEDRRHGHLPGPRLCCHVNEAFRANKVSDPHQSASPKEACMLRFALPLLLACAAAPAVAQPCPAQCRHDGL